MGLFYLKFFLTSILFSLVLGTALMRFNTNQNSTYSNLELMLYSLGLGPVFTVLVLYYLLLVIPRQSHFFYAAGIFLVYGLICIFSFRGFRILGRQLTEWFKSAAGAWRNMGSSEKIKQAAYWIFVFLLLGSFLFLYLGNTLQTPLEHHDALVYGNLGKLYYQQKEIPYARAVLPAENGFIHIGSQKPSFSLLLTWEMMLNPEHINQKKDFDMYFRSTSAYYGLLIIAIQFLWFYRKNRYLALLGLLVLLSGLGFVSMLVNYHLDSFRIFLLLISWIFLAYTIKKKDRFSLFLLGMFSGFAAFTHLIGLAAAFLNCLAVLIFDESGIKTRILKTAALGVLILVFGNIHYLMEALYGSVSGFLTYF
ncbi:MAG: hypothetical protein GTO45_28355 [Candidatus Aminicenantes bacterium]|nr:hypothetical protein [Candidatus Aminicenantes bacterium]NIM82714.1 hypothetical protein [Candidatus Aminicenantes bacterium]NIN22086.1 hypothetical protein [Candidatus Aminicenantes bacterium]NIN45845.1 hypothetical protein [Candidatus Aminicenantes bacterium]NIN88682.1 hypothetical protein [Candidatus Aminicenantes bacterium]